MAISSGLKKVNKFECCNGFLILMATKFHVKQEIEFSDGLSVEVSFLIIVCILNRKIVRT